MSFIVQTDSFIETGGCSGPRNNRSQLSREHTGVTMNEIQDKYIPEFELPYRNIQRYIKEVKNSWNRLDEGQRDAIRKSFEDMNLMGKVEGFANEETSGTLESSIGYITEDPDNVKKVLNGIWSPSEEQKYEYSIDDYKLKQLRENVYSWSLENGFNLHTNWKSGCMVLCVLLFGLVLGYIMGFSIGR